MRPKSVRSCRRVLALGIYAIAWYRHSGNGKAWRRVLPLAEGRSEEHTSELQSLMRISYAVFCLKKKKKQRNKREYQHRTHTQSTTYEISTTASNTII